MEVRDVRMLKNGSITGYVKQKDGSWESFLQKYGHNIGNIVYNKNTENQIRISNVNKDSVSGYLVTNTNRTNKMETTIKNISISRSSSIQKIH